MRPALHPYCRRPFPKLGKPAIHVRDRLISGPSRNGYHLAIGLFQPMHRVALALAFSIVCGCIATPEPENAQGPQQPGSNLWQEGLAEHYETPRHVRTRDAAQRNADVAPPADPGFAGFDAAIVGFMTAQDVAAGQLAVMHDGRLIYSSGYGHTKPDGTGPTNERTLFRMASVTKVMTHALVMMQVEQGLYDWTDPVFCLPPQPAPDCRIPLSPHPDHPVIDPRITNVTVEQLLAHTAGWGRSTDFMYRAEGTEKIREALGTTDVPARWQGAQYMMGLELANDPGTAYWYCNMCYMLASLVAEAATGADIGALFDAYLFRPLGVSGDIELGKAFPADRNPREPFYETDYERPSAYDPSEMVPGADGGYNIEMIAATGGLIGTAAAIAAVYEAYADLIPADTPLSLSGNNPYSMYDTREHGGLLDGTLSNSYWASDTRGSVGILQFVYLFNNAAPNRSCSETEEIPVVADEVGIEGCIPLALKTTLLNLAIAKGNEEGLW